jgi:hypothetical protein
MTIKLPVRLFNVKTMSTVLNHDFPESVFENGYAAVSHVWGEQTLYSPEDIGIKAGIDWKIPLSNLNKMDMLKSAMKKFKMEWCWFDVLCMPQGTENQHLVNMEIPYMGDYYMGAKLTIVFSDRDEYEDPNDNDIFPGITKTNNPIWKGAFKGMIKTYGNMSVQMQLEFWRLEKELWIGRLWTYQEAIMSKQIWLVTPNKIYLDMTDTMKRLDITDDKSATADDGIIMDLARATRAFDEHKICVGMVMYDYRNRECFKLQDLYYGILGILGYKDFPVSYDITMEELGKKFMEYAYNYHRDVSWLATHTKNNKGFIHLNDEIVSTGLDLNYIGDQWKEGEPGACNITFKDTLCMNACVAADVTHFHWVYKVLQVYDVYKEWGFDKSDIVRHMTGHCKLSDGETDKLEFFYDSSHNRGSFGDFLVDTFKGVKRSYGTGSTGKLFRKNYRHELVGWEGVCRVTCTKSGKPILIAILGKCDVGDKIMILPMHDRFERALGIIVDDNLKRKGICLYPKLDEIYEYTPYEF